MLTDLTSFCSLCEKAMESSGFFSEDYQKTNKTFFNFTETKKTLQHHKRHNQYWKARRIYLRTIILLRTFDNLKEE